MSNFHKIFLPNLITRKTCTNKFYKPATGKNKKGMGITAFYVRQREKFIAKILILDKLLEYLSSINMYQRWVNPLYPFFKKNHFSSISNLSSPFVPQFSAPLYKTYYLYCQGFSFIIAFSFISLSNFINNFQP